MGLRPSGAPQHTFISYQLLNVSFPLSCVIEQEVITSFESGEITPSAETKRAIADYIASSTAPGPTGKNGSFVRRMFGGVFGSS